MVTKWGLSNKLGPLAYSEDEGEVFLGRSVTKHKNMSDETAHAIDEEIRHYIESNYERAETILKENMDKLHSMADALMKYETIDQHQIKAIMEGDEPPPPADWGDSDSEPPANESGSEEPKSADSGASDDSIGGPASQH